MAKSQASLPQQSELWSQKSPTCLQQKVPEPNSFTFAQRKLELQQDCSLIESLQGSPSFRHFGFLLLRLRRAASASSSPANASSPPTAAAPVATPNFRRVHVSNREPSKPVPPDALSGFAPGGFTTHYTRIPRADS